MPPLVECLSCGTRRVPRTGRARLLGAGDSCPRCGYVGWARSEDLTEAARRALREQPPALRRAVPAS